MDGPAFIIDAEKGLRALIDQLQRAGYRIVGPTLRDNAIVYDQIDGPEDLPAGWTDSQDGGHYRIEKRDDDAVFGYAVGPHPFKQFLHVPDQELWQVDREDGTLAITPVMPDAPRYAFIGIRSCEIHAIHIQDRVIDMLSGEQLPRIC